MVNGILLGNNKERTSRTTVGTKLRSVSEVKAAGLSRLHTARCHLHDVLEKAQLQGQKTGQRLSEAGGGRRD